MKEKKKTGRIVAAVILAVLVLMAGVVFLLFAGLRIHTATETEGSSGSKNVNGLVTDDLKVEFSYGCDNHVKYNRYVQLNFHVENTGDDLDGKLQVSVPVTYEEGVVYEKDFDIAAGEDKNIKMYIPTNMVANRLTVSVMDDRDSLVGKFNAGLNYQASRKILNIGVVTEEESAVGYLASADTHVYYMLPEELSDDERGLDMLDIIVIDEVASGAFTDAQVEVLVSWVDKGGSLVLGTGAAAEKSLEAFSGSLLFGTIGKTETYETQFDYEVLDKESYLQECYTRKREEKTEAARAFTENAFNDMDYVYYIQHYEAPFRQYASIKDEDEPEEEYFLGWNGEEDWEDENMDGDLNWMISVLLDDYSLEELRENMSITLSAEEMKEVEEEAENNWDVKPISIQHVDLQLEDSTILLQDAGRVLMQKVDYGNGNVMVAQFGMNIPNRVWTSIGSELRDTITGHISKTKEKQLETEEEEGVYQETYMNMANLGMDRSDGIPNVKVYIVILGIYVLLIGPVLYLVCKKKDKRHLLWVIIPACSVLFSLFIYFIGSSTRISDTFINYITCTVLDDEGRAEDTSYIGIISPSNKAYELDIKKDTAVEFCSEDGYYYYNSAYSEHEPSSYVTLAEHADRTAVRVYNKAAFSPTYLELNSKEACEKGIDVDISCTDYRLSGTITNNFGYDLEHAVMVSGGMVYDIGSLKQGEVLDVSSLQEAKEINTYMYESGIESGIWDTDETWEERASCSALCECLINGAYGQYVMGIAKEAPAKSAVADLGYEAVGVNLIVKPFEMEVTKDGRRMLLDINEGSVSSVLNGDIEDGWMYSSILDVYYVFDSDIQVDRLVYSSQNNGSISGYGSFSSEGTISLYNPATADYDAVFDSGGGDEEIKLAPYLDGNNGITIRYEVPQQVIDNTSVTLPTLSAIYDREEDVLGSRHSTSK